MGPMIQNYYRFKVPTLAGLCALLCGYAARRVVVIKFKLHLGQSRVFKLLVGYRTLLERVYQWPSSPHAKPHAACPSLVHNHHCQLNNNRLMSLPTTVEDTLVLGALRRT